MDIDALRKADESNRNLAGKPVKSACYAPFVSLFFTTSGSVQACCRNDVFSLGNIRNQPLKQIWNGGKIAALRKALVDYKFHLGCKYCEWEAEGPAQLTSIRLAGDDFPVVSAEPEWPGQIEFCGSNICNLECMMCSGGSSSAIRGNSCGLPTLPRVYDDRFFEDLREFLPHLRQMHFLGGEPFLTPESHRIWDLMIQDRLQVPCLVTTNATQFNARIERVLEALPLSIAVSLDGVTKQTFEHVRRRAKFEVVIANLHRFHAYTRKRATQFRINFCLMRQNWHELGDLLLFAEHLDCEVCVNTVVDPLQCSLFALPEQELSRVIHSLDKQGDQLESRLQKHGSLFRESVQTLRDSLNKKDTKAIDISLQILPSEDPIQAARRLAGLGHRKEAIRRLESVDASHPDFYFALAQRGLLKALEGDLAGAETELTQALKITRKMPNAFLGMARLRLLQGRIDDALEQALEANRRSTPEDSAEAQSLELMAILYAGQWRIGPAYSALKRLAELPNASLQGLEGQYSPVVRSLLSLARRSREAELQRQRNIIETSNVAGHLTSYAPEPPPHWQMRIAGANRARLIVDPRSNSAKVVILEGGMGAAYDIQLNYSRFRWLSNHTYRLKFRMRAGGQRCLGFGAAKAGAPWTNAGFYRSISADVGWTEVEEDFVCPQDEPCGRFHFDLGEAEASVEIADFDITDVTTQAHAAIE